MVPSTCWVVFVEAARCELYVKMARKRKLDYFQVSEVKESSNAVVDGMVTELSPVKKRKDESAKYFASLVVLCSSVSTDSLSLSTDSLSLWLALSLTSLAALWSSVSAALLALSLTLCFLNHSSFCAAVSNARQALSHRYLRFLLLSEELVEPDSSCIEKVFETDAISWCEIMVRQFMCMRCAVDVNLMGHEGNIAVMQLN